MSKPDGWDWDITDYTDSHTGQTLYRVSVHDCRQPAACNLSGFATSQQAEGAAIDWIQRRIGKPVTVPQPVLRNCFSWQSEKDRIDDMLERLADFEADFEVLFPTPTQADFPGEREHIAAADCWIYRCGLIGALRNSLQAERDLIREKLWEQK